jgi:Protein of unknown function (DUF3168)
MANPELELQGEILKRLKADAAVTALVNGRIYDAVPQGAAFPYVSFGPCDATADDAECIDGLDIFQQIDCWSRGVGYPEVKKIADAVRSCLDDAPLPLPTNGLVFLEHRQTQTRRDPDGLTSHGILSFEASIERQ